MNVSVTDWEYSNVQVQNGRKHGYIKWNNVHLLLLTYNLYKTIADSDLNQRKTIFQVVSCNKILFHIPLTSILQSFALLIIWKLYTRKAEAHTIYSKTLLTQQKQTEKGRDNSYIPERLHWQSLHNFYKVMDNIYIKWYRWNSLHGSVTSCWTFWSFCFLFISTFFLCAMFLTSDFSFF